MTKEMREERIRQLEKVVDFLNMTVRKGLIKDLEKLHEKSIFRERVLMKLDVNYKLLETMRSFIELNKVL